MSRVRRGSPFCDVVTQALPSECACNDVYGGAKVACGLELLGASFSVGVDLLPCDSPATFAYHVQVGSRVLLQGTAVAGAGKKRIGIPGLSLNVPFGIASAGAYLSYTINGNAESFEINLGVSVCGSIVGHQVCGEDVGIPEITILDETLHFYTCPKTTTMSPAAKFVDKYLYFVIGGVAAFVVGISICVWCACRTKNPAAYQHMEMHQTAANHAPPAVVVVARSAVPPVPQQLRVQMQEHHHVQAQPAVVPMAAVQSSVSSAGAAKGTFCNKCGHKHTADAKFCQSCGAQI